MKSNKYVVFSTILLYMPFISSMNNSTSSSLSSNSYNSTCSRNNINNINKSGSQIESRIRALIKDNPIPTAYALNQIYNLLEKNIYQIDINMPNYDEKNDNLLLYAIEGISSSNNSISDKAFILAKYLIKYDINLNFKNIHGETALTNATLYYLNCINTTQHKYNNLFRVIELIIKADANINAFEIMIQKDPNKDSNIIIARKDKLLKFIDQKKDKVINAVKDSQFDKAKILIIKYGLSVNIIDNLNTKNSLLTLAALFYYDINSRKKLIEFLLKNGADVDLGDPEFNFRTLMHLDPIGKIYNDYLQSIKLEEHTKLLRDVCNIVRDYL